MIKGNGDSELIFGLGGDDILIGDAGDDTLDGGAGADQNFGGADADTIVFDLIDTVIDGGTGEDTLLAEIASGDDINLVTFAGSIGGIEVIDLEGDVGANTLTLAAQDVLDMSDTDTVTVFGDVGDAVVSAGGWVNGGSVGGFTTYSQSGATLIVDDEIDQAGIGVA